MRRQPPVFSPLDPGALLEGLRATIGGAAGARDSLCRLIARRYAADDVLLTDSGTSALALALAEVGREAPGLVAMPAYGCFDLATAADGATVDVLLYDVDPGSLSPDLGSLEGALRRGAGAVVVAPLYGVPIDMDAVQGMAHAHGAAVVEDAAQGSGASWRGVPVGAHGDSSILSFGRGKGWTGGQGGALLRRNRDAGDPEGDGLAELPSPSRGFDVLAACVGQWLFSRPHLYGVPAAIPAAGLGETVYREPRVPRAISDAGAAVALATARLLDDEIACRRRHAESLRSELPEKFRAVRSPEAGVPGWLRMPVIAADRATAAAATGREGRRLGIAPGYPCPLQRLAGFSERCLNGSERFRGADELGRRLLTLPAHSLLEEGDLEKLRAFLHEVGEV